MEICVEVGSLIGCYCAKKHNQESTDQTWYIYLELYHKVTSNKESSVWNFCCLILMSFSRSEQY